MDKPLVYVAVACGSIKNNAKQMAKQKNKIKK